MHTSLSRMSQIYFRCTYSSIKATVAHVNFPPTLPSLHVPDNVRDRVHRPGPRNQSDFYPRIRFVLEKQEPRPQPPTLKESVGHLFLLHKLELPIFVLRQTSMADPITKQCKDSPGQLCFQHEGDSFLVLHFPLCTGFALVQSS